jgi:hypothetical protein
MRMRKRSTFWYHRVTQDISGCFYPSIHAHPMIYMTVRHVSLFPYSLSFLPLALVCAWGWQGVARIDYRGLQFVWLNGLSALNGRPLLRLHNSMKNSSFTPDVYHPESMYTSETSSMSLSRVSSTRGGIRMRPVRPEHTLVNVLAGEVGSVGIAVGLEASVCVSVLEA